MQQRRLISWPEVVQIVLIVLSVWLIAALLIQILAVPKLDPPQSDVVYLLRLMGILGSGSVIVAYSIYRLGVVNRFGSLRYTLMGISILTTGIALFDAWLLAQEMFIEYHDLTLNLILLLFAGWTALGCGYFIACGLIDRISLITKGAKQLAAGDLAVRVDVRGNDELASLGRVFNDMAARLQESAEQKAQLEQARRDLIAWVSHDLRTPLASLRLVVEAMIDGVVEDENTRRRYLATARTEINNLNHLIDDLFELSRLDTGNIDLKVESTALSDLLSDTLSAMRALADLRGIHLDGRVEPGIDPVEIDPEKIQRVLYNLLTNAIRHTPQGGEVTVTAQKRGSHVEVVVKDSGEGIAPVDLPHIFERFYRSEQARTRDSSGQRGAGLGLAIVRGLVEAHQGSIRVESRMGAGSVFAFTLPCKAR